MANYPWGLLFLKNWKGLWQPFQARQRFTCTSNLIYCIRCSQCGLLCISKIKGRLDDHFTEHLCLELLVANHKLTSTNISLFSSLASSFKERIRNTMLQIISLGYSYYWSLMVKFILPVTEAIFSQLVALLHEITQSQLTGYNNACKPWRYSILFQKATHASPSYFNSVTLTFSK